MKKLLFILILMPLWALQPAQAQNENEYIIGGITTSGIKFLDQNAIINLSGLRVGDKIRVPGTEIGYAIKKLWKQGLFGNVDVSVTKIEGKTIFLNIHLEERPKVSRIFFEGIRKGQKSNLEDKTKEYKGKVASDVLLKNIKETIRKHFAEKGFFATQVEIIQKPDTLLKNAIIITAKVQTGKKSKVKDIITEGNVAFSEKKIRKKMKIKERTPFRIFHSSKYIVKKFEEDKERILRMYNKNGYRDARIVFDTAYFVSHNRMNIRMQIEEGKKYYFRNITWEGNIKYTDEQLSKILNIKKGDVYDPETLEKKLNFSLTEEDITSLYMDDGHLFFRITPIEKNIEGDSIDVEMRIYEGPQAVISKVIINGNTKTSDKVILREIRTKPGMKFSRRDIIRTTQALGQLGMLDPEKIDPRPIPNQEEGTVDIIYNVEEKPSDMLEMSGGWGAGFGFVGTLGVSFNNFSIRKAGKLSNWRPVPVGDAQRLSIRAQANGRSFQTYSVSFTEPWLGGKKPNNFTVFATLSNLNIGVNRFNLSNERTGYLKMFNTGVSLGKRLRIPDDYFTLSHSLSFQYYDFQNYTIDDGFASGYANSVVLSTNLSRNSIDNPTFPRTGSMLSLNLSFTPPYSLFSNKPDEFYQSQTPAERFKWLEYYKLMFDGSFYTPLVGKLVLASRIHFGFLDAYRSAKGIVPFERFTLGGGGLAGQNFIIGREVVGLRGYEDNAVRPLDPRRRTFVDGTVFAKYVLELRYPISLNPAATVFVLGFYEAGNNWLGFERFNPFKMYRSAGIGVRFLMPAFGMIGLDWGRGFDQIEGLPAGQGFQNFTFTIGQQIR
ncbi:outer membrane protein assembly factor BamA [Raineya orbicola]|jgi:outer membrane protein insertion porin family|uniref:Outer membrane protein assembly factor BamA n=1 Tax=Raineya orbicola TaxID=2016530 RepID=A0A2N3IJ49_9BACT|nr:outer membrane protein assembly factor BamA [Raineya orbicola]PKQ70344.1 Outer membrane protein assembly complex, YaeT protein [Raineya orbicola]